MNCRTQTIWKQLLLMVLITISMGCNTGNAQQKGNAQQDNNSQPKEFPYPEIPTMLTDAAARLDYLCEHFWDRFDFNDSVEANRLCGEQGLANFINLSQQTDEVVNARAAQAFAKRLWQGEDRNNYLELTEHYLYDPESPLRNDLLYAPLLEQLLELIPQTDPQASKLSFILKNVQKNQVGSIATDFRYIDRNDKVGSLHQLQGTYTLLYLYDPDCENCQKTLMHMRAQLQDPRVKVLAVYPDKDLDLWKNHQLTFKEGWIDSYSPNGEINDKQLYFIQATPSIYLLDKDKRVILKDASLNDVLSKLNSLL